MIDPIRKAKLDEISAIAVKLEAQVGVPAQLLVSQWALESRWGAKPVGQFNFFGIKRASRHTQGCGASTHEYVDGKRVVQNCEFAEYASLEDACMDYAWMLSHARPYAKAWAAYLIDKNALNLLKGIAKTYASDPAYAKLLQAISGQGDVVMALGRARQ